MDPFARTDILIAHLHTASLCLQGLPLSRRIGECRSAALHLGLSSAERLAIHRAACAGQFRNDRSVRCSLAGFAGAADLGVGRPREGRASELSGRRSIRLKQYTRKNWRATCRRRHAPDAEGMKQGVFELAQNRRRDRPRIIPMGQQMSELKFMRSALRRRAQEKPKPLLLL
jgi:hypothetical protein